MASSKQSRSARNRRSALGRFALVERLETRVAMAAGITLDRSTHTISIIGTAGNDTAQVRQNGSNVVVALTTPSGRFNPTYRANTVSRINFSGLAGNDNFQNLTALPSRADGGSGTDTLRGGRATDERLGGDGNDQLFGDADNDPGFRVRVQNGQFGNLVTGVWRYMTPDKIQIWAKWAYPANDPSQLKMFVQYSYTGPYSGNMADYTNPDNYVISPESRIYAGYMTSVNGGTPISYAARPATTISWLPSQSANFSYSAPSLDYTGFAPPIQPLREALGSMPNFENFGESFSAELSPTPGIQSAQTIIDLLRTISQVNATWYAQRQAEPRR